MGIVAYEKKPQMILIEAGVKIWFQNFTKDSVIWTAF